MPKGIPNSKSVYIVSESSVRDLLGSIQTFLDGAQTVSLTGGAEKVSAKPIAKRGRKPRATVPVSEKPTIQLPKVD